MTTATDWLWTRTHLTQWHELVDSCGWSPARARRHLVDGVVGDLVAV